MATQFSAHKGNTETFPKLTPQEKRRSINAQVMNLEAAMKHCMNEASTPEEKARIKAEFIQQIIKLLNRLCAV